MSPEEIARVLAAMRQMKPLEIPGDVASDLDAWERRPTRRRIDHDDDGIGDAFRLRQALDVWKLWLVETAAAFEYGRLAFELKTIGRPMGQNDIMIAAIALSVGDFFANRCARIVVVWEPSRIVVVWEPVSGNP